MNRLVKDMSINEKTFDCKTREAVGTQDEEDLDSEDDEAQEGDIVDRTDAHFLNSSGRQGDTLKTKSRVEAGVLEDEYGGRWPAPR